MVQKSKISFFAVSTKFKISFLRLYKNQRFYSQKVYLQPLFTFDMCKMFKNMFAKIQKWNKYLVKIEWRERFMKYEFFFRCPAEKELIKIKAK